VDIFQTQFYPNRTPNVENRLKINPSLHNESMALTEPIFTNLGIQNWKVWLDFDLHPEAKRDCQ
jgi:hypothetical protein